MLQYSNAEYKIISVKTAEEALTLTATAAFDLYVLDYHYPQISGIEICRQIRRTDESVPIIFFAGEAHERERREALEAGVTAYLVKPNDLANLTNTAKQLLGAEKLGNQA